MWTKNPHSKLQRSWQMKKRRQSKVVGVELRAGGDFHGSEKPGWSAGDMAKQPGNQMKIQHQQNEKHRQMKINEEQQQQQQNEQK